MARISLAPGFRFHPTDVELIMYFLKRKVMGKKLVCDAVTELDIYKFAPWDLPDKCPLKSEDLEWYFFTPRERKYAVGARSNRATENGYWKITGIDKVVTFNYRTVGMRKTLIFYKGCPPKGERTDWVMHEYRLEDKNLVDVVQDAYVLCKIFQKGGLGPKSWAQHGALFKEEEWGDMDEMFVDSQPVAHQISSKNIPPGDINVDAVSLSVPRPRDLSVNFVPELHPSRCLLQNTVMQPSMKDIFMESSAVGPNILPDYVPPDTRGSSAAICMAAPGNFSTWPTFKSGPFTDGSLAMDIPSDMDILSLLNMFTEDTNMPAVRNNSNEKKLETNGHSPHLGENGIYNDSWDLNDWIELADIESGISTKEAAYDLNPVLIAENELFLELNDLIAPLRCPPEAVQLDWLQTGSIYAVHNGKSTGMDEFYSGVADLCPVEKVSGFGECSALLEGPHLSGNNLKDLEKVGNCIVNFEAWGSDAVRATIVPSAVTEPEGGSTAEEKPEKR